MMVGTCSRFRGQGWDSGLDINHYYLLHTYTNSKGSRRTKEESTAPFWFVFVQVFVGWVFSVLLVCWFFKFLPGSPHHREDCWKRKEWSGKSSDSYKARSNIYHAALLQEIWEPTHVLYCTRSQKQSTTIRHIKTMPAHKSTKQLVPWECQHINSYFFSIFILIKCNQ